MKYLLLRMALIVLAGILLPTGMLAIAQNTSLLSYKTYWPIIYTLAEDLVAKRGVDANGNYDGMIYVRKGWGPCLVLRQEKWDDFVWSQQTDRYMSVRDYADENIWATDPAAGKRNCPHPPLEVRPARLSDSRPVYLAVADGAYLLQGSKSKWRVEAPNPPSESCSDTAVFDTDHQYRDNRCILADGAMVYKTVSGQRVYTKVSDTDEKQLIVVADEQDVSILDWRQSVLP